MSWGVEGKGGHTSIAEEDGAVNKTGHMRVAKNRVVLWVKGGHRAIAEKYGFVGKSVERRNM